MGIFDNWRKNTRRKSNAGGFFERSLSDPPARNTAEWLATFGTNPRLAPVDKIAVDLSTAKGKLYLVQSNGKEKELKEHPFLDFWNHLNPLPEFSNAAIWRLMQIFYSVGGESVAIMERGPRGYPAELWPVPPHWVMETPHRNFPYYVMQSYDGHRLPVPITDVFIMKNLKPLDPYGRGLGKMEAVADEVESYEYATKFAKRKFYNDARADYFIAAPGITEEQADRFLAKIDKRHRGINNAYRPGIIPRGDVAIHKLSDTPREMEFIESRKDLRDTVNAHINMPPELLGIVENSNRATAEAAKAIYAENVLMPELRMREDAINRQLVPQFGDNLVWRFDDIIPEDEVFRLQVTTAGVANGSLLLNEWRAKNGFEEDPKLNVRLINGMLVAYDKSESLTSVAPSSGEITPAAASATQPDNAAAAELAPEAKEVQTAKEVSLNGAQIASLMQVVQAVNAGELTRESALEIITAAFPFDRTKAESILGTPVNPNSPVGKSAAGPTGYKARQKRPPNRGVLKKRMAAERVGQTRSAEKLVGRYLERQLDALITKLGEGKKDAGDVWEALVSIDLTGDKNVAVNAVLEQLDSVIDWSAQSTDLQRTLRPIWQSAYTAGSSAAQEVYGISNVQQPQLTQHLLQYGAERVKGITDTTKKQLASAIADGVMAGDGRGALIKRVRETVPGMSAGRAHVIAASEVHSSLMSGNFDMLKAAGYRTKTWLTSGDADVRSTHAKLNGVTIPIDDRFDNHLLYPGDPSGPPAEIIGCRCDLVAGEPDNSKPASGSDDDSMQMTPVNMFKQNSADADEAQMYLFSKQVQPEEGYEDVFIHGDATRFLVKSSLGPSRVMHPEELAQILRDSPNYDGGNIRLLSCEAGREPDGAAQQLADALGVEVKAPNRILHIGRMGDLTVADDKSDLKTAGEWVIFKPRR